MHPTQEELEESEDPFALVDTPNDVASANNKQCMVGTDLSSLLLAEIQIISNNAKIVLLGGVAHHLKRAQVPLSPHHGERRACTIT